MNITRWITLALAVSMVCTLSGASDDEGARCREAKARMRIAEVRKVPSIPVYGSGDSVYWSIVRMGKPALNDLLVLVGDPTTTGIPVPYYGGSYCIGDVAVLAMMDIVHDLPVAELVAPAGGSERHSFASYWQFVRQDPVNRRRLQRLLGVWLNENRSRLVWSPASGHPAAGWYRLPS
jgi:hypothetical protein